MNRSDDFADTGDTQPEGPSKSARKREAEALQTLGERLVGLPGETIRIGDDRHVYINGRRLETSDPGFENVYSFDPAKPPRSDHYSGHLNGTIWSRYYGWPGPTLNFADEKQTYTIRPGHYLTFGDNTLNSADSRVWAEPDFPEVQIIGKESFVFWPFGERWGWSRH